MRLGLIAGVLVGGILLSGCGDGSGARTSAGREGSGVPGAGTDLSGPMRMRAVTLFSSGVGYFEQAGTTQPGTPCSLTFTRDDLDDVLKSLVVEDADGSVAELQYPSTRPLAQVLRGYPLDLARDQELAQMLRSLAGTRLSVRWQGRELSGALLGIETRSDRGEAGAPEIRHRLLTIVDGAGRTVVVPLEEIDSVHFDDPVVADGVVQALAAISAARSDQRRTVTVRTLGTGAQALRLGYVTAAPLWKASYRLVLSAQAPTQAQLQGWAIVDNHSEEDWSHISLSLVSGRPQSFIEHLSQPIEIERPRLLRQREARPLPVVDRGAAVFSAPQRTFGAARGIAHRRQLLRLDTSEERAADATLDLTRSIAVAMRSAELDERSAFTLDDVSLPHARSALLPFLNQPISAENLSIFTAETAQEHPLRGVLVTNTSGVDLSQGPIAVFDAHGWVGDASLDALPAHDHRLLSYAQDLSLTIHRERPQDQVRTISWSHAGGVLSITDQVDETTVYRIARGEGAGRTLIVEIPTSPGWVFTQMAEPFEHTPTCARFRVELGQDAQSTFVVHTRHTIRQGVALTAPGSPLAVGLASDAQLPEEVRSFLGAVIAIRTRLSELSRQDARLVAALAVRVADQQRLRHLVTVLDPQSVLAQRLRDRLGQEETEIEGFQQARRDLRREQDAEQDRLVALVDG